MLHGASIVDYWALLNFNRNEEERKSVIMKEFAKEQ